MNKWFINSWIVVAALSFAVLVTQCGCTYIDWQKYVAQSPNPVVQVTNKSPFSDTIGENFQLSDCKAAEKRMEFAIGVHNNLIRIWHKMTDEEQKDVIVYEIRQLEDYVGDIKLWMSDNCSEA